MLFRSIRIIHIAIALVASPILMSAALADETSDRDAQIILHVLDYVSVDYGGSVLYGKVLNEREFAEQSDFAAQAATLMGKLPETPAKAALVAEAVEIADKVKEKASADEVGVLAQRLRKSVIETYQVTVSPRKLLDTLPALALYQQLCVPCHGVTGHGDGPLSKSVTPKPADFFNDERMDQRSVYGLYNSISLGVGRTAMPAFTQLSDDDRWALAFLVSNLRTDPAEVEVGRKLWQRRNYAGPTPDIVAVTTLTENEISTRYGNQTHIMYAYLRSDPRALLRTPHATLIFAAEQLDLVMALYREGNVPDAQRLAISAYLEGFEPIEIGLDSLDKQLRHNIENKMMNVRQLVSSGVASVATLAKQIEQTKSLLKLADEYLRSGKLSVSKTFFSAVLTLLKEGLAAALVLAALLAFVIKNEQRKALSYVYLGGGGAILLGVLTWAVATWMTEISGISREITSSMTALIASIMLIYLVFWLYKKSLVLRGHESPVEQLSAAFVGKNLWMLTLLAFVSTYHATVKAALFYEALWVQSAASTRAVIWSGLLAAAAGLLIIGWGIFRVGLSLSGKALLVTTLSLLSCIAIIFAGQGINSLQKAGIVATSEVSFISLPMLGIIPTTQTLATQLAVLIILILGYQILLRRHRTNVILKAVPTPTD